MDNIARTETKRLKENRNHVEICDALFEKLKVIQAEYHKASAQLLRISIFDSSKILNRLIDDTGGIKGKIKIV